MYTDSSEIVDGENALPASDTLTAVREERPVDIPLPAEFEQQLAAWNTTQQNYPQNAPIRQLVVLQAAATADAVARVLADRVPSYGEFKRSACTPLVRGTICRL